MSNPVVSTEIPARGIWRQASVSRKLARQQAFRLLTIPLDEKDDDSDDEGGNSEESQNLSSNETDKSYLDWEMDLLHQSQTDIDNCYETGNAKGWMIRFDSLRKSITSNASAEIPIREIAIDGDYEERNFSPSMEIRRKADTYDDNVASALGIDPQLNQLLRQVKRVEQKCGSHVKNLNKSNNIGDRRLKNGEKKMDRFGSLRGSLIRMCEAIRTGLDGEIMADSASSRSDSLDSTGNLDDEEIESFNELPDRVGHQDADSDSLKKSNDSFTLPRGLGLDDDDSVDAESLNSFSIGQGCNDSVALALDKIKKRQARYQQGKSGLSDSTFTATTVASTVMSSLRSSTLTSFSFSSFSDDVVGKLKSISDEVVGETVKQQQQQQQQQKQKQQRENPENPLSSIKLSHRSGKRRGYIASSA
ncbi:hypothetical protein ACHAXS_003998 [Conticribra weissflogii]